MEGPTVSAAALQRELRKRGFTQSMISDVIVCATRPEPRKIVVTIEIPVTNNDIERLATTNRSIGDWVCHATHDEVAICSIVDVLNSPKDYPGTVAFVEERMLDNT